MSMTTKASVHQTVSSLVRVLLKCRGPSKQELADYLGMPRSSLSHALGGDRPRYWQAHELRDLDGGVPAEGQCRAGQPGLRPGRRVRRGHPVRPYEVRPPGLE
jgi:hypothetical protein